MPAHATRRQSHWVILIFSFSAALLLLSSGVCVEAAAPQQSSEIQKLLSPQPPGPIPVAEIATRATQVTKLLNYFETKFTHNLAVDAIESQLTAISGHIDLLLETTNEILQEQPPLATLQAQQQIWKGMHLQINRWLLVLTEFSVQLNEALDHLDGLQKTWIETRDATHISKAPELTFQEIASVLTAINTALAPLQNQQSKVLDLQSRIAEDAARCSAVLKEIDQAQDLAVSGIFERNGLPIWSFRLWAEAEATAPARFRGVLKNCQEETRQYLIDPSLNLPWHAGLFLVMSLMILTARARVARREASGPAVSSASGIVLNHPFATALIGASFVATLPTSSTPDTIQSIFEIAMIFPMIHLTRATGDPRIIPGLYGLCILFAVNTIGQAIDGVPLAGQAILLTEMLAGSLMLGWSLAYGNLRSSQIPAEKPAWMRMARFVAVLILLAFATGFATGSYGFTRLSRIIASQILAGGAMALAFYTYYLVLSGVVSFCLGIWPLRLLQLVQHHRSLLEQRICRLLRWLSLAGWVSRCLAYMGLLQPALFFAKKVLTAELARGSIRISLSDILAFFLTVWAAYLLSALIRFVLKEDVYPRTQITPGMSYAISSLMHYVILATGLVVGMGVMGVSLSQVTILAGAFSVGIGFGLQGIVNNFVCGLILLFERPIHVGDVIEVDNLTAEVRRIGIRASTVRTRRGSDIIVPNSLLLNEKLTNWTYRDQLRRIAVSVSANYGAAPQKVIAVLEAVANANPRVLKNPPPYAILTTYGDSAINYELRAWTDENLQWRRVHSELAIAIYDAVQEAGITFPFPQREVRILHDTKDG